MDTTTELARASNLAFLIESAERIGPLEIRDTGSAFGRDRYSVTIRHRDPARHHIAGQWSATSYGNNLITALSRTISAARAASGVAE